LATNPGFDAPSRFRFRAASNCPGRGDAAFGALVQRLAARPLRLNAHTRWKLLFVSGNMEQRLNASMPISSMAALIASRRACRASARVNHSPILTCPDKSSRSGYSWAQHPSGSCRLGLPTSPLPVPGCPVGCSRQMPCSVCVNGIGRPRCRRWHSKFAAKIRWGRYSSTFRLATDRFRYPRGI
jgi:hypothetical protein